MASAILAGPAVISFPVQIPEKISQHELTLLLSLRKRERQLSDEIEAAEESLLARLQSGASVETGPLQASIKTTTRRNVAWKEVVTRKLGAAFAQRVLAATRPDTYTSLSVVAG